MTKCTRLAPVAAILLALGTSAAVAQTTGSTPSQDRGMNNATAPDPRTPAASGKSDIGRPGFDANSSVRGSTGGATTSTLPGARGSTQGTSADMTTGADTSTVDKTKKTSSKRAKKSGTTAKRNGAHATPGTTNASPSGATGSQGTSSTTGSAGGSSK